MRKRFLFLAFLALGCGKGHKASAPPAPTGNASNKCAGAGETVATSKEQAPDVTCTGGKRQLLCYGEWAAHCGPDNKLVALTNCRAHGEVCAMHECSSAKDCNGCLACRPGTVQCGDAGERMVCRDDGSGYDLAEVCDETAGLRCSASAGVCADLCAMAAAERSYIGCDYWAVATSNSELAFDPPPDADGLCQPFPFAVVVANAESVTATVTIKSQDRDARTVIVAPGETQTVELPCSPELKGSPDGLFSTLVAGAAHHITSDVPITVYQFNPLAFESKAGGDTVYSFTNDSSLLLPTNSLTGDYVAMTQPTRLDQATPTESPSTPIRTAAPGFVAVIGVEPTPTDVEIISSAYTLPSKDGKMIPALAPGDHYTATLNAGDVLQILSAAPDECVGKPSDHLRGEPLTYCKVSKDYDLTGTQVKTAGKVSVISGHDCAFIPYNRFACDHLEETMFPSESWGKDVVFSVSETVACQPTVPNMVRILSSADGNHIDFGPAVHAPVVLDKGEFVEFEVADDFRLSATAAVQVAQFLLGQDYNGHGSSGSFAKGDPSMSLAIPVEQWRTRYPFLVPETYTDNYVNIIAREHQLVLLDDRVVTGFVPIGSTKLGTARVPLKSGQHLAESAQPFGIVLYGYAIYTSYMMPGGLELNAINDLY